MTGTNNVSLNGANPNDEIKLENRDLKVQPNTAQKLPQVLSKPEGTSQKRIEDRLTTISNHDGPLDGTATKSSNKKIEKTLQKTLSASENPKAGGTEHAQNANTFYARFDNVSEGAKEIFNESPYAGWANRSNMDEGQLKFTNAALNGAIIVNKFNSISHQIAQMAAFSNLPQDIQTVINGYNGSNGLTSIQNDAEFEKANNFLNSLILYDQFLALDERIQKAAQGSLSETMLSVINNGKISYEIDDSRFQEEMKVIHNLLNSATFYDQFLALDKRIQKAARGSLSETALSIISGNISHKFDDSQLQKATEVIQNLIFKFKENAQKIASRFDEIDNDQTRRLLPTAIKDLFDNLKDHMFSESEYTTINNCLNSLIFYGQFLTLNERIKEAAQLNLSETALSIIENKKTSPKFDNSQLQEATEVIQNVISKFKKNAQKIASRFKEIGNYQIRISFPPAIQEVFYNPEKYMLSDLEYTSINAQLNAQKIASRFNEEIGTYGIKQSFPPDIQKIFDNPQNHPLSDLEYMRINTQLNAKVIQLRLSDLNSPIKEITKNELIRQIGHARNYSDDTGFNLPDQLDDDGFKKACEIIEKAQTADLSFRNFSEISPDMQKLVRENFSESLSQAIFNVKTNGSYYKDLFPVEIGALNASALKIVFDNLSPNSFELKGHPRSSEPYQDKKLKAIQKQIRDDLRVMTSNEPRKGKQREELLQKCGRPDSELLEKLSNIVNSGAIGDKLVAKGLSYSEVKKAEHILRTLRNEAETAKTGIEKARDTAKTVAQKIMDIIKKIAETVWNSIKRKPNRNSDTDSNPLYQRW